MDAERAADHLRHRDRLADRAAGSEHHCGDETTASLWQDDTADHLPARRAERERSLLEVARNGKEELPCNGGGDRQDHHREDEHGRQVAGQLRRAFEERQPPEPAAEERPEVVLDERAEDEDPPETDHDARDRGEQLDERRNRRADPARCELGEEERDSDRGRRRDKHCEERQVRGAEDEVERAELAFDGIPRSRRQETEPELRDRKPRLPDELVHEQADDDEHSQCGGSGDDVEQPVADAVAKPAAAEGEASR